MASELRVDTLKDSSGNNSVGMSTVSQGSAKVWTHFDGTGSAASWEKDSFNVASYTDNGTGDYTITFSNAMDNANYYSSIMGYKSASTFLNSANNHSATTSAFRPGIIYSWDGVASSSVASSDYSIFGALIHGDLA